MMMIGNMLLLLLAATPESPLQPAGWPASVHWTLSEVPKTERSLRCECWMSARDGQPVRMRGECREGTVLADFLIDGDTAYTWSPVHKQGLKLTAVNLINREDFAFRLFFVIPQNWRSMKDLGPESVDGQPSERYQVLALGRDWQIWQSPRLRFPVKFSSGKTVFVNEEIKVGGNFPGETFAVPAGVELHDLDELVREHERRSPGPPAGWETPREIDANTEPPRLLSRVDPVDPYLTGDGASRPGPAPKGVVVLEGVVTQQGLVREAHVITSVDPRLDAAAIRCVRQWRYEPARRNGCPVTVSMNFTVSFPPAAESPETTVK